MFKKRDGTSGISGHFYETKLISLFNFRAIHKSVIKEFHLASNVNGIGAFDDICLKAKVEGFDKPMLLFIQAKHKENKKRTLAIDLPTYFASYFKIRYFFNPNNKNILFKSKFDKVECLFIIYTNARDDFGNGLKVQSTFYPVLNDLIDTGGTAKLPNRQHEDIIKSICEEALKQQMAAVAQRIAELIKDDSNFESLMNNEIVLQLHVILARDVVDVSEISKEVINKVTKKKKKGKVTEDHNEEETRESQDESKKEIEYRVATFRPDFFNTSDKYLTVFKDILFKEILKNRVIQSSDIKTLLDECLADPNDATKLSKVIGTVVTYNNGSLEITKKYSKHFTAQLKQISVSQLTANQAEELAAKEILLSPKFKLRVPSDFGNKDMKLRGCDQNKKDRILWLAKQLSDLLINNESSKIVTIDETVHKGLWKFNGGLASAMGNVFVLDEDTKLMKVTHDAKSLGPLAKQLYEKLNESVSNLCEYKFSFKVSKFPKVLLEYSENEENLAKDFLDKLVIYSNQADEKGVEDKLKAEIEENLTLSDSSPEKIDEMFQMYHKAILNWWMQPNDYLTKTNEIFEEATSYIIKDPRISSISIPYIKKIKRYNYTFTEDAVNSLNLLNQITIIVAENTVLTIVKVMQHLDTKDLAVLDTEHIIKIMLLTNKLEALQRELTKTNKKNIIFVCDKIQGSAKEREILKSLLDAVGNKKAIFITNHLSEQILAECLNTNNIVHDQRNSLIDMSEETKMLVLKCATVKYRGTEVGLEHLLSGWPIANISS